MDDGYYALGQALAPSLCDVPPQGEVFTWLVASQKPLQASIFFA